MIKIFSDYYDLKGHKYKVISFNGDKYACQSYLTGKCKYFNPDELFDKPKVKNKKSTPEDNEGFVSEPVYNDETEQVIEDEPAIQNEDDLKDNSKETAKDFYADL